MTRELKIVLWLIGLVLGAAIAYIVYNYFIKPNDKNKPGQTPGGASTTANNTSTSAPATGTGPAPAPTPTPTSPIGKSMSATGTGANLLYENFTVFKVVPPGGFIGKVTAERGGYYETAITGGTGKGLVNKISVILS